MTAPDFPTEVAKHTPPSRVNSKEGWAECGCGKRYPVTFDDPEMGYYENEWGLHAAHITEAVINPLLSRVEEAESQLAEQEERHWANVKEHSDKAYALGRRTSIAQVAAERDEANAALTELQDEVRRLADEWDGKTNAALKQVTVYVPPEDSRDYGLYAHIMGKRVAELRAVLDGGNG